MKTIGKLVCLILCAAAFGVCDARADQQLATSQKTFHTPAGNFGIWKISVTDSSSTRNDYWLLFGRLGKWHVSTTQHKPASLLPIVFVTCAAGALVFTAKHRNPIAPK